MYGNYHTFFCMSANVLYITVKNFIYAVEYNLQKYPYMIDFEKTNLLRQKIADEKISDGSERPNHFSFLLLFVAKFLAIYGTLWLILTKFNYNPFNFLETLVIYLTFMSTLWKRK